MAAQGLSLFPVTPSFSSSQQSCGEAVERFVRLNPEILSNYIVGTKLSIQPSRLSLVTSRRLGSTVATVSFSLPTGKREGAAYDKKPKFSARAIKSFAMAELEARKLKYPNTGTEALLMGILVEGTSLAAKFLRENGITLFKVREETVKLLGMADLYVFSPEHPPLTEPAQRALDWAVDEKMKSGESGEITVSHLLLGIWSQEESAGHAIMATFGFDDEKAKELAKTMDKDIIWNFK
ncbi:ATP-dependent Clp protease ATP-binding subunit CLPT1, chloroplastic-like isoform X2 [Primulina tabacum]|uniref:ATP-dependent Clp protease ATP-binding subunit CLPT1, chloroplastic-like isoform X2 n=1 Tax=Primulina tabacum TaxID=48773 RepID=UPI003F599B3E